ncbi:MAG TPA: hypothetical protein VJ804_13130 [Acidimicrobiales bacterium]|nr:hypothetical protein [Acidimicrobiales bacterium]
MTTTTAPTPFAETLGAVTGVRRVVQADAVLCLVSGGLLFAGAGPIADVAGLEPTWPVAAVGGFLLLLGVNLLVLARASARHLLALTPWSAESDFVWAIASVVVAVAVSMTGPGRALVLAQAVVVAAMGVAKLRAVRAAR